MKIYLQNVNSKRNSTPPSVAPVSLPLFADSTDEYFHSCTEQEDVARAHAAPIYTKSTSPWNAELDNDFNPTSDVIIDSETYGRAAFRTSETQRSLRQI